MVQLCTVYLVHDWSVLARGPIPLDTYANIYIDWTIPQRWIAKGEEKWIP